MGLRPSQSIDDRITGWWNRAGVAERALAMGIAMIGGAIALAVVWLAAVAAYLHYLIRTGQFID